MPANRATTTGLEYGPTVNGKMYLSVFKHRGCGNQRHKSMWLNNISPDDEYGIFCSADAHNWNDESRNYWGVLEQGKIILGERGERICKFPCPSNDHDPWHGYPVSPKEKGESDAPPDSLVERWIGDNVVTKEFGRKIQKLKI